MLVDLLDVTMVDYWADLKDVYLAETMVDCLVDSLDVTMVDYWAEKRAES